MPKVQVGNQFEIYYDDLQEGVWFKELSSAFSQSQLIPITGAVKINSELARVLQYDRPDVILADSGKPILVVERTIEVPSGHNVGQRFARLAAAAQAKVPLVYFGPYAAYKHGGETQGPRYMNLRLFSALEAMAAIEKTAVTTIRWPVDGNYEIVQSPAKDEHMREYLALFLSLYIEGGIDAVNGRIHESQFHADRVIERQKFIVEEVEDPAQYDRPPDSVLIGLTTDIDQLKRYLPCQSLPLTESVFYNVGMKYIRSDPYTGMAMLYEYLYAGGATQHTRNMILWFPNITRAMWELAANNGRSRKDVRLFRQVTDAICFSDALIVKKDLQ